MGGVLGIAGATHLAATAHAPTVTGDRAASAAAPAAPAATAAGTFTIGGDLVVNRMGFGAMRVTGPGIWGEPKDPTEARRVLQRAV